MERDLQCEMFKAVRKGVNEGRLELKVIKVKMRTDVGKDVFEYIKRLYDANMETKKSILRFRY